MKKIGQIQSEYVWLGVLLLCSIIFSRVFFQPVFFPTHDAEYHIIRLWQFDQNIKEGVLVPRWAPDLNYGFGIPLFSYFYPLPNFAAEAFHSVGFSYISSVYYALALGYILSGITMYWFTRLYYPSRSAFLAGLFYLLAPYHLVDLYIRGSAGEIWALALVPLVLGFITKMVRMKGDSNKQLALTVFSMGLLLLSHTVIGLLFFAASCVYGIVYGYLNKRKNISFLYPRLFLSYALSIVLVSFHLLPILFESNVIRGLEIINAQDHFPALHQLIFPSWGSGFSVSGISDTLSFQIGIPHIVILIAASYFALRKKNVLILLWIVTTVVTIFLMLDWSIPVWNVLPFLNYMQFPWRLLSIIIVTLSFCAGYISSTTGLKTTFALAILALLFYFQYTYPTTYEKRSDDFYLANPDWTNSTATLGNTFNTKWFQLPESVDQFNDGILIPSQGKIELLTSKVEEKTYTITTSESVLFLPRISYFPGWIALVDNQQVPIENHNGILGISLLPGTHVVMVELTKTAPQRIGSIVSFCAIIICAAVFFNPYERRH
jgi:uncharacterized membrane protein